MVVYVYHAILRGVNKQQVFEDDEDYIRFLNVLRSQPVNDFSYFITLLRYIHQNPLKTMLVDSIDEYEWSSW